MRRFRLRRLLVLLAIFAAAGLAVAGSAVAGVLATAVTTNSEKWALIIGFVIPPVLAYLKRSGWPTAVQSLAAFGLALAAGVGIAYWQSVLSWENWTSSALTILVTSIATYHGLWKPSGAAAKIAGLPGGGGS